MSDEHYATNERWWSERARFHLDTEMYREFVTRLRNGHDALLPFDDRVLGPLDGKRVLHLQCHVGTDTLSLARRGAVVTGLDFSADALERARALATELEISATFVQGNAAELPDDLEGAFDLVYTSYGALCWLGDLRAWASGIAARLASGGRLVVIDGHPIQHALGDEPITDHLVLRYPYLGGQPDAFDNTGSYADRSAPTEHTRVVEWAHGLGTVIDAVLGSGLVLDQLTEHPEAYSRVAEGMVRGPDRLWRLPEPLHGRFPFTFTLVAHKP